MDQEDDTGQNKEADAFAPTSFCIVFVYVIQYLSFLIPFHYSWWERRRLAGREPL
ncbi:hypothetical protein [Brevibacillus dissolubilis]|uniref:hypothetical protein n=1 Tax=Brevibacillus dissolubilis TaxID=1844116 RepID=UPI00159BB1BC|nr:hypothetical protein [Brevibacillus dissolubilis]